MIMQSSHVLYFERRPQGDFPGGVVVKNLQCKAGDECPDPWLRAKIPHSTEQLSLCPTTTEPTCSGACTLQLESPCTTVRESARCSEGPAAYHS